MNRVVILNLFGYTPYSMRGSIPLLIRIIMNSVLKSKVVITGLAMFSMFFGAGNVVFPLLLGQAVQNQTFYAILGLSISAICVPFTGLIAMILFNGDYNAFFQRIGKIPGFILTIFIICLIGPFGAIPRCIALSYSSITMFTPPFPLYLFSLISCLIIFLFTIRPSSILDTLGKYLTPFLLFSLGIIIILGYFFSPEAPISTLSKVDAFTLGLLEGYNTMDLIGAFFFSTVVIICLENDLHPEEKNENKKVMSLAIKASLIGASLLGIIYIGFCYIASFNSLILSDITPDHILGTVAFNVLGSYAGIVTSVAVALACLTTAIALTSVFAEFLQKDILREKCSYPLALIATLVMTFGISMLNFTGIVKLLTPVLQIFYPALIVLSIMNILYKLYHFKPVKTPFFIVLLLSLVQAFLFNS